MGSNPTTNTTRLRPHYIGLSPSGKATDFDSVIPLVRIQLSQPRRNGLHSIQKARLRPGFQLVEKGHWRPWPHLMRGLSAKQTGGEKTIKFELSLNCANNIAFLSLRPALRAGQQRCYVVLPSSEGGKISICFCCERIRCIRIDLTFGLRRWVRRIPGGDSSRAFSNQQRGNRTGFPKQSDAGVLPPAPPPVF